MSARHVMLDDAPELDELVKQWIAVFIDEERQAAWGPPDTSVLPIADICRQLSTPGAYGVEPTLRHSDPAANVLVQRLRDTGVWQLLQTAHYYSLGLGSYITHHAWDPEEQQLVTRLVNPANCWAEVHPANPQRPVAMYELRTHQGEWIWLVSSVADRETPFKRAYRHDSDAADYLGADITGEVYGRRYDGADYPTRDSAGRPVLDYVVRRCRDTGDLWSWHHMRGAFRGSLHSQTLYTLAHYAARDASASSILCIGVDPGRGRRTQLHDGTTVDRIPLSPGQITFMQPAKDVANPMVVPVGAGMNLEAVAGFARSYEMSQLARFSVNAEDVTRASANPTSGAALAISNKGKRDLMEQAYPVLRRADLEMVRVISAVLRSVGIDAPDVGWEIEYTRIPLGADEMRARSEQVDARLRRRTMSRIDAYLEDHPGVSREQAIVELRRIDQDERELNAQPDTSGTPDPGVAP